MTEVTNENATELPKVSNSITAQESLPDPLESEEPRNMFLPENAKYETRPQDYWAPICET